LSLGEEKARDVEANACVEYLADIWGAVISE
jgi:hypothetical protein